MKELLAKAKTRTHGLTHIDAKTAMLQTVFPLFEAMWGQFEAMASNVDHNFQEIYETLDISNNAGFLDSTEELVMQLNKFVDQILVAAGFFVPNPEGEGYVPTEAMPAEIRDKLAELTALGLAWFQQLEAVRDLSEDGYEDDEDEDEGDDDDEGEGDDDDESEESTDQEAEEAKPEPSEAPAPEKQMETPDA